MRMHHQTTTLNAAAPTVLHKVQKVGTGDDSSFLTSKKKARVVYVLGGPGSGKGTQCQKIVDKYGFVHLSAGDLLRAEIQSGSEHGEMIQSMIQQGKIVPSEVTVRLLVKAMEESSSDKFLIDGFPRNEENRMVFENLTGITPEFILFFDCPEDEMERRVLGRNQVNLL
jgi:UMP-CMP kinase